MTQPADDRRPPASLDRAIVRLAEVQYGVVSRTQVKELGAQRGFIQCRLDRGLWVPAQEGVYRMVSAQVTTRQKLMAACLACGKDAVVSHYAAMWLFGLPGGRTVPEVTVPRAGPRYTPAGVVVHTTTKLEAADRVLIDAVLPATNPARILVDMSGVLAEDALDVLADAILSRDLARHSRIAWRLEVLGRKGLRGLQTLRALMEARSDEGGVPASVLESMFRPIVRDIPQPTFNHRVVAGKDRRLDADWEDVSMFCELDGWDNHSGRARFQDDIDRQNALILQDRAVLRYTHKDLTERPQVVRTQVVTLGRGRALQRGMPEVIDAWMAADPQLPD
ncbi:MAG TPA: hypothetical protein VFW71_14135 [Actinomycetota bacterium]|nr:hypothetical protein [Actinomycetota bacterium]